MDFKITTTVSSDIYMFQRSLARMKGLTFEGLPNKRSYFLNRVRNASRIFVPITQFYAAVNCFSIPPCVTHHQKFKQTNIEQYVCGLNKRKNFRLHKKSTIPDNVSRQILAHIAKKNIQYMARFN